MAMLWENMQMARAHCFGQHVNKAQERRMCPESELGLHVYAGHTCEMAILPQYLMDITIQQLPYNITSNFKKPQLKNTWSLFLMTPEPSL